MSLTTAQAMALRALIEAAHRRGFIDGVHAVLPTVSDRAAGMIWNEAGGHGDAYDLALRDGSVVRNLEIVRGESNAAG